MNTISTAQTNEQALTFVFRDHLRACRSSRLLHRPGHSGRWERGRWSIMNRHNGRRCLLNVIVEGLEYIRTYVRVCV